MITLANMSLRAQKTPDIGPQSLIGETKVTIKTALSVGLRASAVAVFLVMGGCALPGYNSSLGGGSWYSFDGNQSETYNDKLQSETQVDYKPRMFKITPGLVAHLKKESASETLSPAQKAVASKGKVGAYTLGQGDLLRVVVYGHPELTNPGGRSQSSNALGQVVSADGTVFFPYVGQVKAAGLTVAQLRKKIRASLSSYIRDPQVDVIVTKYRSQRVYISGDIARPCTVPITDVTLTVSQALQKCNAAPVGAAARVSTTGQATSTSIQNVDLVRNGKSTPLDLNQIYETGRTIPLKSGDRLLVDDSANRIFLVGEFNKQVALPYSAGGMSLNDAIADAGGVNLSSANTSAIYVIRGFVDSQSFVDGKLKTVVRPDVYKLNAGSASGLLLANQFQLKPRDIVFAAPASLVNFNRALALITPSLNTLFQSFLVYDRLRRP